MRGTGVPIALAPVVAGAGIAVASPLVAVAGPLLVVLLRAEHRRRRRRRVEAEQAETLPVVVDHLIQQLRSGASLGQACRSLDGRRGGAGPVPPGPTLPPGLEALTEALDRGRTLADGAQALAGDGDGSVRLLGVTIGVLARNGGPAVPALQRLRHTLVGRVHRRRRAEAQAAQALASARLLVVAPAAFAALLAAVDPAMAGFYLREPLGAACATAALGLSAIGWWWIQRAVARVQGGGS